MKDSEDLNKQDKSRDVESSKELNFKFAQMMSERMNKIEQNQRKRREEERERTRRSEELRKVLVEKQEKQSPPSSKVSKSILPSPTLERLKPSRLKQELTPLILIAAITLSSFIYLTYQESQGGLVYSAEVPTINIDVSHEITNYSQQCFLKFSPISHEYVNSPWANHYLGAKIRRRNSDGGFSFELYQNENLFQIREDDDWLLLPSGNNLDALRTKLAFDIYNMMLDDNSHIRLPHTKLVEVFINGGYQGLYLLSERIDRKMMNLEVQENLGTPEDNDMIFKATNWAGDFYTIPDNLNTPWEQIYPNSVDCSDIIKTITGFIQNSSETEFFDEQSGIYTIFDKESLIDNLLFGLLTGHEIGEGFSYYLILNHYLGAKFSMIPWNFAQSWGFSKHGRIPIELWLSSSNSLIHSVVWSNLYHRLLFPDNISINIPFLSDLINRWDYLYDNIWDSNEVINHLQDIYLPIQKSLIKATKNLEWTKFILNTIEKWIRKRADLIDYIFNTQLTNSFVDNFKPPYREDTEIFGFATSTAKRQYYKSTELFSTQIVHEITITIRLDYFNDILNRKLDNDRYTERMYMPCEMSFDDYSMDNVGFRIRGNYNNLYPKNSFKLKFSEPDLFVGSTNYKHFPDNEDRRFLGVKRLNLRAAPIDFSLMNEYSGYELYNVLGYPCPRLSWTKLNLILTDENNNIIKPKEYIGLYLLTEDIDKTFLRFNFKDPDGNLYKTTDILGNLDYVPDVKTYVNPWDGRQIYELRTNEDRDDYSDLQKFVNYINFNWSNIQQVTNFSLLAKYFTASNFQGNWDDYVFLPHNFFLYSHPKFGFIFIPWDIEQNFNIGTNFSIIGFESPYSPDFRFAPLLTGYKGYFDWISIHFGIDPDNRPLWDNLITEPDFVNSYYSSHQKIIDNMTSIINKVDDGFYLIGHDVLQPYTFTDPVVNPAASWLPNEIPLAWYLYDQARIYNFLSGRTAYVISQLP
ncbi:MAG: CotH kinase family protein [Promethearchaeota archaeon]